MFHNHLQTLSGVLNANASEQPITGFLNIYPCIVVFSMENWYKESFTQDYVRIYQHRDKVEAESTVDRLLDVVSLPENPLCLDLCCGFGRHLSYLNKKGIPSYGIDLSQDLIAEVVASTNVGDRVVRGDMRNLPFVSTFDFVFSFFSSFGYFSDDQENILVLKEISRVLKPGGGFLIDFLNSRNIKQNLKEDDHREHQDFSVTQRRWINTDINTVEKELTVKDARGTRTYRERVKLYDLEDFKRFCLAGGLAITQTFGDADGNPFRDNSNRLIMIGEKIEVDCL